MSSCLIVKPDLLTNFTAQLTSCFILG